MPEKDALPGTDAYQFIKENLDTVPHLEALMLIWNSRPVGWTCEEVASRLYIASDEVTALLKDLVRLQVVSEAQDESLKYSYLPRSTEQDELMSQVDAVYRRDLVRVSNMIHSKASTSVREFARAFRFRKEQDR
jgi:hypothetical protein